MSKHREALRRGIRFLIQETSRELADLEGREAPAETPEPAQGAGSVPAVPQDAPRHRAEWSDVQGATEASVAEAGERAAEDAVPSAAGIDVDDRVMLDAEVLAVEVREVGPPRVGSAPAPHGTGGGAGWRDDRAPTAAPTPATDTTGGARDEAARAPEHREPAGPDARDAGQAGPRWGPRRLEDTAEPPTAAPSEGAAHAEPTARQSAPAPKAHRAADAASARPKARARKARPRTSPKKGAAAAARRRAPRERRPAAEHVALNGVDPRQVHTRKGVCSAYFMNHECWRVSDAYCNTALHVCAMRDCPVYHLHQEALERRFAAKYKHLW
ncbi:MAG TPA: hypothetical protein VEZ44_15005 [bacterium]|nr:hypothetical protein [bacterium]